MRLLRSLVAARHRWAAPCYALLLTLLIAAPLLGPGYLLLRDAVSTPRSFLSDAALGLTEPAPRALPQDVAVALGSAVIDGGVLVKALLVLGLFLAGYGAAGLVVRVLPNSGLAGQLVAVTVAIWNPYVAERLLQGHWSLLVGYGCLPWVATAMLGLRHRDDGSFWRLAFWIALAGLTSTGLMMAATVALVCAAAPASGNAVVPASGLRSRRICAAAGLGVAILVAVPWLTASAMGAPLSGPPNALAAFAARAEPGLGTLGSLAALGGIWNAQAVPGSRTTLFALVGSAVLVTVVALGLPAVLRRPVARALLLLSAVAIVVPATLATGLGISALEALVGAAPGLGVVRDGQKWVGMAMPGYALACAGAVLTLQKYLRPAATSVVCCLALVAVLPDLAWGVGGNMRAVRYPQDWPAVAQAINADPRPVAVLPAGMMRQFTWSARTPVLDPLPRWVRAHVLTTGDLTISGQTLPGEGAWARQVQQLLLNGADSAALARAGVGWVVVEAGTRGEMGSAAKTLEGLPVVVDNADPKLYRVGGDKTGASDAERATMIAAHLLWLSVLAAGAAGIARHRHLRRRR